MTSSWCDNGWYEPPIVFSNSMIGILPTDLGDAFINASRPRQNSRYIAYNRFKRIFFNGIACISIKILLKFLPKGPISNILALVQKMAWRRSGDKPLSETMVARLLTQVWVTRPEWVNTSRPRHTGCHFPDDISNGFSWIKIYKFRLQFHWKLFLWVLLTISQHWIR